MYRKSLRTARKRAARWALLALLSASISVFCASSAHAVETGPGQLLALAESVNEVLDNIRNWIMGILAGLATVFLTVGGVRYLMAGGDPGEVEKAKTAFKSAGWGYGLAALAPLVVAILKGIVGAEG
ncbi:pilin [Streptomyces sp. NPDC050704]|uniref:pilin n=1 Tax=Streptomyces sp. NPDC050704 TaxID=3157219 RepID=UPI003442D1ED